MDKCTFCAGGPEEHGSAAENEKYGRNRLSEGKLPLCAEMCSTKSLLAGDGDTFDLGLVQITRADLIEARDLLDARQGKLADHKAELSMGDL